MNRRDVSKIIFTASIIVILNLVGYKLAINTTIQKQANELKALSNIQEVRDDLIIVDSSGEHSIEVINEEGQFSVQALSENVINRINGVSWKKGAPVDLEDLAHVEVTYWGFDGSPHLGELIVHKSASKEIAEIFKELYQARFPIEKIKLIDEYNGEDELSMRDNNTSAFCFRVVEGSNNLSQHSYGVAIDINPVQNPYIKGDVVSPNIGKQYLDRQDVRKGMIVKNDVVYNAFVSRGWTWGGEWNTLKDYQHFQKDMGLNQQ